MMGSGGGSGGEHDSSNSPNERNPRPRHSPQQIQQLEAAFKECPHPDKNRRGQLATEIGLEPRQIKFWFQNKRTQTKANLERADNNMLRAENERIWCENRAIIEALKNLTCPSCRGPPIGQEEHRRTMEKLQMENAQLKEEREKVKNLAAKRIEKPMSQLKSFTSAAGSPFDLSPGSSFNQMMTNHTIDQNISSGSIISNDTLFEYQFKEVSDKEKAVMGEIATRAMDELITLLLFNDPLWIESAADGRLVLHRDNYDELFPRASHFQSSIARVESSKESGIVTMSGMELVEMLLDTDHWVDLFPTIVTKAKTIHVQKTCFSAHQTGALKLMYEQIHILSPLVPPREFYFLRHCRQVELGTWVMVDVSYDCLQQNTSPSCCWRLPSGCMIREMPNGYTKVTWVEHMEVEDRIKTHILYRDLVCSNIGYGAHRWVYTLQRMAERFAYFMGNNSPSSESGGVITSPEGKRSIMKLGHRMLKNFCGILNILGMVYFPQLSEVNCGVQVSVRKNTEAGQPGGKVVIAATSLWLPFPPQKVFDFFRDQDKRVQWDVLSNGNPVEEIAQISTGTRPGNCLSIIRPFIPNEQNMLIFQESYADPLGSLLIYTPIDVLAVDFAIRGEDSSSIPILPSGFVISGDGRPETGEGASTSTGFGGSDGSLLTVALQILISSPLSRKHPNMENVSLVNTLMSCIVQKIQGAFNISGL